MPGDSVEAHVADTARRGRRAVRRGGGRRDPARRPRGRGPAARPRRGVRRRSVRRARRPARPRPARAATRRSAWSTRAGTPPAPRSSGRWCGAAARAAVLTGHVAVDVPTGRARAHVRAAVLDDAGRAGVLPAPGCAAGDRRIRAAVRVDDEPGDRHRRRRGAGAAGRGRWADLEFVQFHPTVLYTGPAVGRRPLVTEAVRGEGAVLLDRGRAPFMAGVHPLADLAPRDVVAAAITRRMAEHRRPTASSSTPGARRVRRPLPDRLRGLRAAGVDPARDPIPVGPAAHYACGGVVTDVDGRTGVPGLYAAGEVARTGLHGANRLASNSLLEGLVVGRRVRGGRPRDEARTPASGTAEPGRTAQGDLLRLDGGAPARRRPARRADRSARRDPGGDERGCRASGGTLRGSPPPPTRSRRAGARGAGRPRRRRGRGADPAGAGRARGSRDAHRDPRLPRADRLPRRDDRWQRESRRGRASTPTGRRGVTPRDALAGAA